ncbi:VirB4 family type IV secretion system protein [Natrinema salaciae]|uniref:AAA-like domain-containing protein n=1 Tax=Natrinema salaciae TaxID=1186196 RepID=A0A1H9CJK0_9EURY|nr:type IV secretory system conjugative DNA transfer family protein [Natrinema salaciae]SEQ01207.1 AAA-like domain-containing protein [Natrinema salaciae]
MSTNTDDGKYSARRIHHTLGGTTAFFHGYSIDELLLFVSVAFVTLVGAAVVPAAFTIPVIGFGLMLGIVLAVLHKVKPSYLWLTEWIAARLGWAVKNKEYTHGEDDSDVRYLTRVGRVYPHALERTDGALVGAVKIEPANMALEDDEAWAKAVRSLSEFVNATIDFPVKFYITSRDVDQDDVVRNHQHRLGDADVRSRPVLRRLLEEFIARNTDANGDVDSERTTVREYYVITAVRDSDVEQFDETGDSVLAYLADVRVLGRVFSRFESDGLTEPERERLKEEELESRLAHLRRGASSLYRCSVSSVDAYELARVTTEYWTGHTETYGDITDAIGTFPVVTHGISENVPSDPHPDDIVDTMDDSKNRKSGARSVRHNEGSTEDDEESGEDSEWKVGLDDLDGESEPSEADDKTEIATEEHLDDPSTIHQSVIAPSTVDWETTYAIINDETYVRTFWVEQFPEEPPDGMFERLLLETDLQTDISIHLDPFDSQSAEDMMAEWISDLKVNQHDSNSLKAEDLQEDIDRGKFMRSLVRQNKASFYRGGIFIRLSAESKQELDNETTRLRSIVKDAPANSTLKVANRWQEKGLATVSPLGRNELGRDRMSTMTNQAVGAMFPFSSNYMMMDEGVEYGYHGHNGSPVRINPWELETGHSELVVGMPGAGKTFGAIMRHLRMMKRQQETMLVMIDPVGGFEGIADALNAKTITVGGDTRLNPLEIRESPRELLEAKDGTSPLSAKKDEVLAVLENFLTAREIDLGTETGVLSYVIDEVYRQAGVVEDDISTHTPENSPTMADVHRVLADIAENPDEHNIAASESARERAAQYADELAIAFQPFREGGAYENLSKRSEIDILEGDNKVVYIDLGQIEGTASGIDRQTFLMQLLLSTVYQQAKKTDKNVELAIDEAHYLFEDQANLDFLETAFRHQRHAGLRMVLLSQTAQEFYETDQAEKILSMCPIKVFHKLPDLDEETADKIGLTREQRQFVRGADAGKEELGYSQGLVRVEEHGTYPLHVVADDFEKRVIDYAPDDRAIIENAINDVPEELVEFERFVESEAQGNALQNRFGLTDETVAQLAQHDITAEDVVDAVVSKTLKEERTPVARPDGGESMDDEPTESTLDEEDAI